MYSADFRWRAITLHCAYNAPCEQVGRIFGVSGRTVRRWYKFFKSTGHVMPNNYVSSRVWDPALLAFVGTYVKEHPCFYAEELQVEMRARFGEGKGFSAPSILRLLKFDLGLRRKVIERRVREAVPQEIEAFLTKIRYWYVYPEQLVFVDETSKNSLDSSVLLRMNPWPLPRSIVMLDNACIHMYPALEAAIHSVGAVLLFLPPYCPQFNPIEIMFGQLKRWLARHANLTFPLYPENVLEVAIRACVKSEDIGVNLFRHCGYCPAGLAEEVFAADMEQ
ncbi:Transposase [Phytophthora palmivora]|uniref:Transposase n=1 Tax=Phytophthora palmivora TaxID=4796 RepID=A0A2P4Y2I9_9STRA|nr:Transposase [Phytophthora palmivora]